MDTGDGSVSKSFIALVIILTFLSFFFFFFSSIDANITLDSSETTEWSKGSPGFVAAVKTFNGPMNLNITLKDNVPVSPLQLQVQNNLAQTSVSLDAYYQGTFSVQTKMSQVFVKDTAESPRDDPANANRLRTLEYDQTLEGRASGWVGWGFRPMGNQHVVSRVTWKLHPHSLR
jgi:hypothetical protein